MKTAMNGMNIIQRGNDLGAQSWEAKLRTVVPLELKHPLGNCTASKVGAGSTALRRNCTPNPAFEGSCANSRAAHSTPR